MKQNLNPNTDTLLRKDLEALTTHRERPCVSIYMAVEPGTPDPSRGAISLKNHLREAENQLRSMDVRPQQIEKTLAAARALLNDNSWWQRQAQGLAVFLHDGEITTYRVPFKVREMVLANTRFYIKPLLPTLEGDGRFAVLSLDLQGVTLYDCARHSIEELDLGDVQTDFEDFMQHYDFETSSQTHAAAPGGRGGAMHHGHGASADDASRKKQMQTFLQHIDKAVCAKLGTTHPPMVLVGSDTLRGLAREVTHYPNVVAQGIDLDPKTTALPELHALCMEHVREYLDAEWHREVERYETLASRGDEKATHDLRTIVEAAHDKRIDVLFLPLHTEIWGDYDNKTRRIELREEWRAGRNDLYDVAAAAALCSGTDIHATPDSDAVPGDEHIAAILRF